MRYCLLLLTICFGTACAFTPQAANLSPDVQVASSGVGHERVVAVTVVDERLRRTIGSRGNAAVGANITAAQDPASVVQAAIISGLSRQGFSPTAAEGAAPRQLRVELRNLDYNVLIGLFVGTLRTEAGLKGICIVGSTRPYEQMYHGEHEESVILVQTASANEEYINAALSQAINNLLQNMRLIQCLAGPASGAT